jgi:hypothetical protein
VPAKVSQPSIVTAEAECLEGLMEVAIKEQRWHQATSDSNGVLGPLAVAQSVAWHACLMWCLVHDSMRNNPQMASETAVGGSWLIDSDNSRIPGRFDDTESVW